jgi:hypothetical protein
MCDKGSEARHAPGGNREDVCDLAVLNQTVPQTMERDRNTGSQAYSRSALQEIGALASGLEPDACGGS